MPAKKAKTAKEIREKLARRPHHLMDALSKTELKKMEELRTGYKTFLSSCKTEREAAVHIAKRATEAGFELLDANPQGQKVFDVYKNKVIGLAILGKKSVENGVNMVISHIDAPRLDLKQNPLYEDCNVALAKTHYYGGIKKYQWVTIPLALHGLVVRKDGSKLNVSIGEKEDHPVFTILDLLPHLGKKAQYPKKLDDIVPGEKLNMVMGGNPYGSDSKVKSTLSRKKSRTFGSGAKSVGNSCIHPRNASSFSAVTDI